MGERVKAALPGAMCRRWLLLPLSYLALSACATNALRVEYAGDVAAKGKVAAAASRTFLVEVDKARVASNVDLMALDPACVPDEVYIFQRPDFSKFKDPDKPPRGWYCSPGASASTFTSPLSLAPIGSEMEPTFVLIDALAAYSDGLLKIVSADDPGAADFTDAYALAQSADKLLAALAARPTIVPAATDPRLSSTTALVAFLQTLAAEQRKVDQLRTFLASDAAAQGTISALRGHLAIWDASRRSDINFRIQLADALLETAQKSDLPAPKRREFARAYYDRSADAVAAAALRPALDDALSAVAEVDGNLRRVMREHPNLTAEERSKVARLNRQRLTKAFDTLASVILAFRGA